MSESYFIIIFPLKENDQVIMSYVGITIVT